MGRTKRISMFVSATALLLCVGAGTSSASERRGHHDRTVTYSGRYAGQSTGTDVPSGFDNGFPMYSYTTSGAFQNDYFSGTYSGSTVVDSNGYTPAHPCSTVSGTTSYKSEIGTLVTVIDPARSTICQTSNPAVRTVHIVSTLGQGSTGVFTYAKAALMVSDGTSTGGAGSYAGSGTGTTSLTF